MADCRLRLHRHVQRLIQEGKVLADLAAFKGDHWLLWLGAGVRVRLEQRGLLGVCSWVA